MYYICLINATEQRYKKQGIMKILTQSQVNKMTKKERQVELDRLEDLMCNTDYTTTKGNLLYEIYSKSANQIINKQNGEY